MEGNKLKVREKKGKSNVVMASGWKAGRKFATRPDPRVQIWCPTRPDDFWASTRPEPNPKNPDNPNNKKYF